MKEKKRRVWVQKKTLARDLCLLLCYIVVLTSIADSAQTRPKVASDVVHVISLSDGTFCSCFLRVARYGYEPKGVTVCLRVCMRIRKTT